ncbi:uncharacterized protein [Hyperolius riggenbachi]|uniref:uncharacterized protein n=1 Tax=Hyperolius riggenbachi TaxID=752182 RepID=UPI0035A27EFB
MSLYAIGIFSRSAKDNYQWLMDHLQKSDIGKWLHVCSVYGSRDHRLFKPEMSKCRFAILYHTVNHGQMNIAEVPDSLYYYELRALSRHLGKENVIVVVDDVMDSSSAEEERILKNQPSIELLARDLFLFKEDEKDPEKLLKINGIIQRRIGPVLQDAQEVQQIQIQRFVEDMNALLKDLEQKRAKEREIKQDRKNKPEEDMHTLIKDFTESMKIEHGGIQQDQKIKSEVKKVDKEISHQKEKRILLEKIHGLCMDFKRKTEGDQVPAQMDQQQREIHRQAQKRVLGEGIIALLIDFKQKCGVEDGGVQQGQKKTSAEATPLLQVQFVPREEIQIDESCILGAGAFGTVHKGSYQGTAAAVKKILCVKAGDIKDIVHEIQVSMGLHHPNIVKLMAATRTDTHILLANEYIHGDNLERILHGPSSKVQISEEDKLYVGLELMQALQYIHSKNIIHQDIKPANILVEARTKKTLLTDWGMANIRITICPDMYEKIGQQGGTLAYMAPECLMQEKPASKMSDMWSGGATVIELFTMKKPWNTRTEIFKNMNLKRPPQSLASMNLKQLPLLKSCFSYEPKQRPSAADMVVAMKTMKGVNLEKRYGFAW